MKGLALALSLAASPDLPPPPPPASVMGQAVGIEDQVVALAAAAGVPESFSREAFADPRRELLPDIAPQIGKPAEALTYEKYRKIFMIPRRIDGGAQFVRDHDALLSAVAARYHVDKLVLVSLAGVETMYGTGTGKYPVFNALYTIAEKVPARSAFGARELAEWLKLCWEDRLNPFSVKGSYAGAFGFGQFIPSTFDRYAIDFDHDGLRRFDQWPDVLASIANYLVKMGYPPGATDFRPHTAAWNAVYAYNHSANYVNVVFELRGAIKDRLAGRP